MQLTKQRLATVSVLALLLGIPLVWNTASSLSSSAGTIIPTENMAVSRSGHTATLLPDGRVLIAGGMVRNGEFLATAELYDPATGTFSQTGEMTSQRVSHRATLLSNGKVLITGGLAGRYREAGQWMGSVLSTAELYDPATGRFTPAGKMTTPRRAHAAVQLNDGKVLLLGGTGERDVLLSSAELYDPATRGFTPAGSMQTPRVPHVYLAAKKSWESSLWKATLEGVVTLVYGPAPGFPPSLLVGENGIRYSVRRQGDHSILTRRYPDGTEEPARNGPARVSPGAEGSVNQPSSFSSIGTIAWGPDTAIYFSDGRAVRKALRDGTVKTIATIPGKKQPDLPSGNLWGIVVDKLGFIFVADYGQRRVLQVTQDGQVTRLYQAERPRAPTGIVLSQDGTYVLEHGFTPPATLLGPCVRRLARDATAVTVAVVK